VARVNRLSRLQKNLISFFKIFQTEFFRYIKSRRSIVILGTFFAINSLFLLALASVRWGFFPETPGMPDFSSYFTPPEGQEAEWAIGLSMGFYFGLITMIIACYFGALFAREIKPGTLRLFCVTPISRNIHLLGRIVTAIITTYIFVLVGHGTLSIGLILIFSNNLVDLVILGKFLLLFLKLQILQLISIFFAISLGVIFGLLTKKTGTATILFFMIFTLFNFLPSIAIFLPVNLQNLIEILSPNYNMSALTNWFVPGQEVIYSFSENQWIISLTYFLGIPIILFILALHHFQHMDLD